MAGSHLIWPKPLCSGGYHFFYTVPPFFTLNTKYITYGWSQSIEFKSPEDLTPEEARCKIIDPATRAFLVEIFEVFFYLQMDTITNIYSSNAKEDPLPNIEEPDLNENVPITTSHGGRRRNRVR